MEALENQIDYMYDPETGYGASLRIGLPPYPSVTGTKTVEEAKEEVLRQVQVNLDRAQEPNRTENFPKS